MGKPNIKKNKNFSMLIKTSLPELDLNILVNLNLSDFNITNGMISISIKIIPMRTINQHITY